MDSRLTALCVSLCLSAALCLVLALLGRWHRRAPTAEHDPRLPLLGAILWLAPSAAVLFACAEQSRGQMAAIAALAAALFAVGWLSELLPVAPARVVKWLAALGAGVAVAYAGVAIKLIKLPGVGHFWQLGALSVPLTALWIAIVALLVLVANRADGLVPGVAALSSGAMWAVAALAGEHSQFPQRTQILAAAIFGSALSCTALALLGCRFRVGVGGSLAVGFLLGALTVLGLLKHTAFLVLVVPALVLGAPVLSGTMAYLFHREEGLGTLLLSRERRSLVDVLVGRGMTDRQAVVFLLCWHAFLCVCAVLLTGLIRVHFLWKTVLLAALLLGGGMLFYVTFKIAFAWRWVVRGAQPEDLSEAARLSEQVQLLGVRVDRVDLAETLARIVEFIESRTPHMIVTSDVTAVVRARSDPEFAQVIAQADLVTPDGTGVVWGARLLDVPFVERVPGCDLVDHVCRLAAQRGYRVFLLGAAPGVAERAARELVRRYPALNVAGTHHGYFSAEEEAAVVRAVASARPDILFVAMGIPKQEKWIRRHLHELGVPLCMGVGGSFDVIAGDIPRAPAWMQRCGLEWLWRTLVQPRRLPRLFALPKFFVLLLWSRLCGRPRPSRD